VLKWYAEQRALLSFDIIKITWATCPLLQWIVSNERGEAKERQTSRRTCLETHVRHKDDFHNGSHANSFECQVPPKTIRYLLVCLFVRLCMIALQFCMMYRWAHQFAALHKRSLIKSFFWSLREDEAKNLGWEGLWPRWVVVALVVALIGLWGGLGHPHCGRA